VTARTARRPLSRDAAIQLLTRCARGKDPRGLARGAAEYYAAVHGRVPVPSAQLAQSERVKAAHARLRFAALVYDRYRGGVDASTDSTEAAVAILCEAAERFCEAMAGQ